MCVYACLFSRSLLYRLIFRSVVVVFYRFYTFLISFLEKRKKKVEWFEVVQLRESIHFAVCLNSVIRRSSNTYAIAREISYYLSCRSLFLARECSFTRLSWPWLAFFTLPQSLTLTLFGWMFCVYFFFHRQSLTFRTNSTHIFFFFFSCSLPHNFK